MKSGLILYKTGPNVQWSTSTTNVSKKQNCPLVARERDETFNIHNVCNRTAGFLLNLRRKKDKQLHYYLGYTAARIGLKTQVEVVSFYIIRGWYDIILDMLNVICA